jgi:hypothetical protein
MTQPSSIYVWLVPSEQVQEQPGSWRIRKWDTEPFPEANYTLTQSETVLVPGADWVLVPREATGGWISALYRHGFGGTGDAARGLIEMVLAAAPEAPK